MTNLDKITQIFDAYCKSHSIELPENIKSDLIKTSYDSAGKESVYKSNLNNLIVLDMDVFTQKIYYDIYGDNKRDNMLKSPDALLINDKEQWFFIEFKNSTLRADKKDLKINIIQKSLCAIYEILDVLSANKSCGILSNYKNPLDFFRSKVTYILVCSQSKNPNISKRSVDNRLLNGTYRFTPEFMQKLSSYFFCDAFVYTENYFEKEFVNSFNY